MKSYKLIFSFLALYLISLQSWATSCADPYFSMRTTTTSEQFEQSKLNEISDYLIYGLRNETSVSFSGGYATQSPSSQEYTRYQWVVASSGEWPQGESSGEGILTFAPVPTNLSARFEIDPNLLVRIQLSDEVGGLIREYTLSNETSFEFKSHSFHDDVDTPIREMKIIIDGGEGAVTVSQLRYSRFVSCGGVGYFSLGLVCLLLLARQIAKKRRSDY